MNETGPAISVVIPMKNSEAFIQSALLSVFAQSIRPLEVFIIDDGSTDNSRTIVEAFAANHPGVHLLDGPQKGPAAARNVALARANGDYIAFLDSDDLWPEDKLSVQMARFAREPAVDVVAGFVQYFRHRPEIGLKPDTESITEEMFHVHLGAGIFRKTVFDTLGRFDESYTYSEDVDLMLRIRDSNTPMAILEHVTLYYRRHPDSMTSKYTVLEKRDFHRAIFRSMTRRKVDGKIVPIPRFRTLLERVPET